MTTYLFYDLETSGLDKAFDQVFQFAAIRTNEKFEEIERHQIHIALSPYVLPSPEALIIHQIPFQTLLTGVSEYEGIKQIHGIMNQPKTCSLGYNTLGFDDEFLRFSFYRNLLPPYQHQYANQCYRMDLYPMLIFYYLYHQDLLKWPEREGKLSLKLEALNEVNNWYEGASHQAIVDVEVSLQLARVMQSKNDIWQYLIKFFDKAEEQKRLQALPIAIETVRGGHPLGLYIQGKIGVAKNFQAQVLGLGFHQVYRNQTLWLHLEDPQLIEKLKQGDLGSIRFSRKKLAEPGFLLPPKARFMKAGEDLQTIANENLAYLKEHPQHVIDLVDKLCYETYPLIENIDPQAALYQAGFLSNHDTALCLAFHQSSLKEQVALIDRFDSEIVKALALRLIFSFHPEELSSSQIEEVKDFQRACFDENAKPVMGYRGERARQKESVMVSINALLNSAVLSKQQKDILQDYMHHFLMS